MLKKLWFRMIYVRRYLFVLSIPLALHAGFASENLEERIEGLESKVNALEQQLKDKISKLEQKLTEVESKAAAVQAKNTEQENKARQLLNEISSLATNGKVEEAKSRISEFKKLYQNTDTGKKAARFISELETVGKDSPEAYEIDKWFLGEEKIDLTSDDTTILLFWEKWCPHCRREVPKIQKVYDDFREKGLQVLALTKGSRGTTDEEIEEFLETEKVTYPNAKETGELSKYFNVRGVPAAAVVKNSKVIWRGHPARINDKTIESWIAAPDQDAATPTPL